MIKKTKPPFNKIYVFLFLLFVVAFGLRIAFFPSHLFFGPEQGIDFLVVKELVINHKLTLIGAKTDISGIFHGPIYYYVLSIPFILSKGDPFLMAAFLIFINSLTVFFIYLLGKEFHSQRTGIIAAVLFVFSFNAIVYCRWLSTHPLAIPLATLTFLSLILFLKGNKKSLIGFSFFIALLMQAEFLNLLFYTIVTFLIVIIFNRSFKKQPFFYLALNLLIIIALSIGPFILFDLRHQFLITTNVISLVTKNSGYYVSLADSLQDNLLSFFQAFSATITPFISPLGIFILLAALFFLCRRIKDNQNKFFIILLLWLLIPLLSLFCLRHNAVIQAFVSLIPVFIILAAIAIDRIWQQSKTGGFLILTTLILINFSAWLGNIPRNINIFFQSTQPDFYYSDQLAVIDWVYKEAKGTPFSFQSYTIPYFLQQGWEYLFWSYGYRQYGYLPLVEKAPTLFVIIQRDNSNQLFQDNWLEGTVSQWGTVKKVKKIGELTVRELAIPENRLR